MKTGDRLIAIAALFLLFYVAVINFVPTQSTAIKVGSLGYITVDVPSGSSGGGGGEGGNGYHPVQPVVVFADSESKNQLEVVDWGTVSLGSVNKHPAFLCNPNSVSTQISLSTANWNPPEAQKYFDVTLDVSTLKGFESSLANFVLKLGGAIVDAEPKIEQFSFDMILVMDVED